MNKLQELINEYKNNSKEFSPEKISTFSSDIMDKLECEYSIDDIKDMLEATGFTPIFMDKDNEDELYWACIDFIESELWK